MNRDRKHEVLVNSESIVTKPRSIESLRQVPPDSFSRLTTGKSAKRPQAATSLLSKGMAYQAPLTETHQVPCGTASTKHHQLHQYHHHHHVHHQHLHHYVLEVWAGALGDRTWSLCTIAMSPAGRSRAPHGLFKNQPPSHPSSPAALSTGLP